MNASHSKLTRAQRAEGKVRTCKTSQARKTPRGLEAVPSIILCNLSFDHKQRLNLLLSIISDNKAKLFSRPCTPPCAS